MKDHRGEHEDAFAIGTWQLVGWLEGSGGAMRTAETTHDVRLRSDFAGKDPRSVFFSFFYHGAQPQNVVFAEGEIVAFLDQPAVAPIPAHRQEVRGWYRPDAFELRIAMPPIAGPGVEQVVNGRRLGD